VIDAKGTPWVMARGNVYWWDGERWVQAKDGDGPYRSAYYLAGFHGGSDRGAYMSQQGPEEHQGFLFRLEAGRATKVADFYYDTSGARPGLYVSKSGDLFNFGARFVAVLQEGKWNAKEVRMDKHFFNVSIADFGPEGPVVFVARQRGLATVWNGEAFRTQIALPDLQGNKSNPIGACRWGKDRVLSWRYASSGLAAVELAGDGLKAADVGEILEWVGADSTVYDGWAAPDGSVWLLFRRRDEPGRNLGHILADGACEELGVPATSKLGWDNQRFARYPDSALLARDGTLWLGTPQSGPGIASVRDGKVEIHDWRTGLKATSVNWLCESPDHTLFAAGRLTHKVYHWDPEAAPDRSLTQEWEEIVDVSPHGPLADFSGCLWMIRQDQAGKVSKWDGESWHHLDVPFEPRRASRLAVDDSDHLIVAMRSYPEGTYVVGAEGTQHYKDIREALVARVQAGARRFRSDALVGPIVTGSDQIWFAYSRGSDYVEALLDGRWEHMALKDVRAMGLDEKKDVVLVTGDALWTYRTGQFVRTAEADENVMRRFRVVGDPYVHGGLPFIPGLPASVRAQHVVLARMRNNLYWPLTWEEAAKLPADRPAEMKHKVEKQGIYDPHSAFTAPGGGFWIRNNNSYISRWFEGRLVRLDAKDTPIGNRIWHNVGVLPSGCLWIVTDPYTGGRHVFVRKGKANNGQQAPRVKKCEVKNGRRLRIAWDLPSENAATYLWKTSLDEHWRPLDSDSTHYLVTTPGEHQLRIEARAMGALGVLGPATIHYVSVDVRLPRTRWTGGLPEYLGDLVWVVPVDAEGTADDIPRRIEWRLADGQWRTLPENRRLPVAAYSNKAVELQFRALEADVFVDPEPLSIKVAVEFVLKDVIGPRIDLILSGTEKERRQAIEDLKAAPEASTRLLRERLSSLEESEKRCRQALRELERAGQTTDFRGTE